MVENDPTTESFTGQLDEILGRHIETYRERIGAIFDKANARFERLKAGYGRRSEVESGPTRMVPVEWWTSLRADQLVEGGVHPDVAAAMGALAANRIDHPEEAGAIVTEVPFLGGSMSLKITKEHPHYKALVEEALGGSAVTSLLTKVLRPYEGVSQTYLDREIKRASDIVCFNERLETEETAAVLFLDKGLNDVDFFFKAGRSTGQPLQLVEVAQKYNPNNVFSEIQVPTTGHVTGVAPTFSEAVAKVYEKAELISEKPWAETKFIHKPDQVTADIKFDSSRTPIYNQTWMIGEDTITEFAHCLAQTPDSPRDNPWGFENTRLQTAAKHTLLLLKGVVAKIGIDIEETPEIKARFDDWRDLTQHWTDGQPETVETNSKILEGFIEFNDGKIQRGYPEHDARPRFIEHLQKELGM